MRTMSPPNRSYQGGCAIIRFMPIPQPGQKVRGSESGSPLMAVFDLLGRRWAMGIVWNLKDGPLNFRALQEKCSTISPSILNTRLKDLREAGIIEHKPGGYSLTFRGCELQAILEPLYGWSCSWSEEVFGYMDYKKRTD